MLKLSIITINRNKAEGLHKTMESVLAQTYTNFEYIVIDGASTDGSVEIIKQYEDLVSYWISEPDKGIYNAMNKGILQANGEYCLFLNSGDYLYDKKVLENVFALNFGEDIVYGNQLVFENNTYNKTLFLDPEHLSFRSFSNSTLPHQCTFIKRTLFNSIGLYNEENKIVSDWEFNLLALFKFNCSVRKIDTAVSVYDTEGISSSTEYVELHKTEKRAAMDRHFSRIMMDMDAFSRFEMSKTYKLMLLVKKILS